MNDDVDLDFWQSENEKWRVRAFTSRDSVYFPACTHEDANRGLWHTLIKQDPYRRGS